MNRIDIIEFKKILLSMQESLNDIRDILKEKQDNFENIDDITVNEVKTIYKRLSCLNENKKYQRNNPITKA